MNVCVQKSGLFRMCVYVPTDEEKVALLLRHEAELAAEQAKRTMTLRQRRDQAELDELLKARPVKFARILRCSLGFSPAFYGAGIQPTLPIHHARCRMDAPRARTRQARQ